MMQEKRTLIIIDADINLTEDLQRRFMLEPEFEIVNTATTGMDGLSKVQRHQPHFIVVSNPLPDIDTIQLISNLNMVAPQAKKIVSLEVENPMLSSQCMQAGAVYALVKPYSADKLIEIIKSFESKPAAPSFNGGSGMGAGQQQQGGFYPPNQSANPVQNIGNAPQQGGNGAFSFDQFKSAMNQFSQEQEQRNSGMGQGQILQGFPNTSPGQAPQQPNFNQGMNYNQFNTPNPNFNQMGVDNMNQGQGFGGNFPPPQMGGGMGMGGYQQPMMDTQFGMNTGSPQQRGFRTLKQTIIAINCPKGGVGKTTISKELALAYATVKVNGQPLKVCLVDCNLDFGDVTSMLKLNPYPNITHWTSDIAQRLRENPNSDLKYTQQQIEQKYLITHPTGLKVLSAPSNHTDALDITGKEMEIVLDNLKNCDFDIIILDTGNNTKDYTLISLDKASTILMVTTLEVTTINDTNLLLNTLRSIQFPTSKIQLVVNKMPKTDKDIDVSEISQVLRAPIIGIIPDFQKIRQLNNSGSPAVLGKECEFTAAIRKLGNTLVPVFNRALPPQGGGKPSQGGGKKAPKENGEGGGFFSKFFGKK